jgi:ribosomal protein S12 methylthiotransferase accessory factor
MSRDDLSGDAAATDSIKRFCDGTHRIVEPEATLARVLPLAQRMGITRVAVLTGLDTIGIPVAAAVRPNSRSLAQHQGKGLTLAAAKASAVMEAVETHHAETITLPLRMASYEEFGEQAVKPTRLPFAPYGATLGSRIKSERFLWIATQDLMAGEPRWVPFDLVSADFTHPVPSDGTLFQATTNGLASGNSWLEAVLHGLYEVVERDAVAIWRAAPSSVQDARAIDLATIDAQSCRHLIAQFQRAGMQLRVWDVSSDVRLPVFVALVQSSDDTDAVEPQLGTGCHISREVALSRALTEAAQARITVISGARDDFVPADYMSSRRSRQREIAAYWLQASARRPFASAPDPARSEDLAEDLRTVLATLGAAGIDRACWVDLSQPEFDIPVVRVVVPGLEGPWTLGSGEYVPGERARAARAGAP